MNALMQSRHGHGDVKRSMSPLRNTSNDRIAGGNAESAFARSPLGVKRTSVVQPTYQLHHALGKIQRADDEIR